jgi:hypothetical protein
MAKNTVDGKIASSLKGNTALDYIKGLEERHNQSAEARSVGAHAYLGDGHPLYAGAERCRVTPTPPTGMLDDMPTGLPKNAGGRGPGRSVPRDGGDFMAKKDAQSSYEPGLASNRSVSARSGRSANA